MNLFPSYCIDISAFIDLWRGYYPSDVFESLWKNLENLISAGFLFSPKEVLEELKKRDDELLKWAKKHKKIFINLDQQQLKYVKDIETRFPTFIDPNKSTPEADPFVIALAISQDLIVITSEKKASPGASRPKIPDVCSYYNLPCISLLEFFREQKWKF
jgi:hypothetical protein